MLEFKRLSQEDIDELLEVRINAFAEDEKIYGFGPPGYDSKDSMRESFNKFSMYKMVLNSKIIGGMSCRDQGNGEFSLGGIYIDEVHQNQGIGARAMAFLEREFPEAKVWRLETPYKSFRNQHFYEKLGYIKVGETEPDTGNGEFYLFLYEKRMPE